MERRKSRRVRPAEELLGKVKATVPARILDLSVDGAQIEVGCILRPAAECDLWLPGEGNRSVKLRAEVRRCRAAGLQSLAGGDRVMVYRAGLRFEDLNAEARAAVERHIARNIPADDSGRQPTVKADGRVRIRINSEDIHRRLRERGEGAQEE